MWPEEITAIPILQESRKDLLGKQGHFNIQGVNYWIFHPWGNQLLGVRKQHQYQASAPWRTQKNIRQQHECGDGRRKLNSLLHGQDHHQHKLCFTAQGPLYWRQEGEGMQGCEQWGGLVLAM